MALDLDVDWLLPRLGRSRLGRSRVWAAPGLGRSRLGCASGLGRVWAEPGLGGFGSGCFGSGLGCFASGLLWVWSGLVWAGAWAALRLGSLGSWLRRVLVAPVLAAMDPGCAGVVSSRHKIARHSDLVHLTADFPGKMHKIS